MRILVTGVTGFAGSFLADLLLNSGHYVYGLIHQASGHQPYPEHKRFSAVTGNILQLDEVKAAYTVSKPDLVFHLAGQASPTQSWDQPARTFAINTGGTANVLKAAQQLGQPRVVVVTSAHMYDTSGLDSVIISESTIPAPVDPYGVSKWAAGKLVTAYHRGHGLPAIEARPFNHIGPRQTKGFVVPDFASQIAEIKLGIRDPIIRVGNLSARRDFTDVRDVAEAYQQIGLNGQAGETYIICSGKAVSISDILGMMIDIAKVSISVETDPTLVRPVDVKSVIGSYKKLEEDTGWRPKIELSQSLSDAIEEWMVKVRV